MFESAFEPNDPQVTAQIEKLLARADTAWFKPFQPFKS